MDKAATLDATTSGDVRLRKGSSLKERLIRAGSGLVVLLIATPEFIAWISGGPPPGLGALFALPLGWFLIGGAALERNVAWIITRTGIITGEQRPPGGVRKRLIEAREIASLQVRKNRLAYPASFSLVCRLASGDVLVSPPLPDVTRVNETCADVARLLGRSDVTPVDNPLDAMNAEIRLGSSISFDHVRDIRRGIVVLTGLGSLPLAIALLSGLLSWTGTGLWALGLLVALALHRYAYLMVGKAWVIRQGEISIQRVSLNGRPSAQTIRSSDIEAVDLGRNRSDEGNLFTIKIRLRTGKTLRSPSSHDEDQALAVRAEIIRRLGLRHSANSSI
ncbi:hypothetical protein [Bradyrhizobium sp.]|uniref:hypothetical protein n=1 Tax=Bradyrhizobium sp. TaxID=376 RepID=UPI0025C27C77|nr:hypothetical protein [Bradyrhizobium sp.]MBV8922728.1 hypothetical protein [Bradyrhizobium sp.]